MSRANLSKEVCALCAHLGIPKPALTYPKGSVEYWRAELARAQQAAASVDRAPQAAPPVSSAVPAAEKKECAFPVGEFLINLHAPVRRRVNVSSYICSSTISVDESEIIEDIRPCAPVINAVARVVRASVSAASVSIADAEVYLPIITERKAPTTTAQTRPAVQEQFWPVSKAERFYRVPDMHDVICSTNPIGHAYHDAFVNRGRIYLVGDKEVECINYPARSCSAPMLPKPSGSELLMNYVQSHNLIFDPPRPTLIAWDIETYNEDPRDPSVPSPESMSARLGMIAADVITGAGDRRSFLWLINPLGEFPTPSIINGTSAREYASEQEAIASFIHFVRDLAERAPVILHGYNASVALKGDSGFDWRKIGYDLPFVLLRTGIPSRAIEAQLSSSKALSQESAGGGFAKKIDMVNLFGARVHIIDTMDVMIPVSRIDEKMGACTHIESWGLNAMLAGYGLAPKHDMPPAHIGPILRERAQIGDHNIDKVAEYCLRDAAACNDLLQRVNYLDRALAFRQLLGVPLFAALHGTQAAALMFAIAGTMRAAAFPFVYAPPVRINEAFRDCPDDSAREELRQFLNLQSIPDYDARTRPAYRGGYNMTRSEEILADSPSIMLDYQSLYPSVMLAFRISPFTFRGITSAEQEARAAVESGAAYALENDPPAGPEQEGTRLGDPQLSPDGKSRCWLLFAREPTLNPFLSRLDEYFQMRLKYKRDLADAKAAGDKQRALFADSMQYAVKIAINTLYGLTGSPRSCFFFNYESAAAVCLAGRIAIHTAMRTIERYGRVIYSDTDSACLQIAPGLIPPDIKSEPGEYARARDGLVARINGEIRGAMPPCDRGRFAFQFEKTFARAYFPTKKKTYAYLKVRGDPRRPEDYAEQFDASGFQFSKLSARVKVRTLAVVERWLRTDGPELKRAVIAEFLKAELQAITENPRAYACSVKTGQTNVLSILRRHPEQQISDKRVFIIPVRSQERLKTDRWELADSLPPGAQIATEEILKYCYASNLSRIIAPTKELIRGLIAAPAKGRRRSAPVRESPANDTAAEGRILIREERAYGGRTVHIQPKEYKLSALAKALVANGNKRSYHEILPDTHKLVFDIDAPLSTGADRPFCLEEFVGALSLWLAQHIIGTSIPITVLCANSPTKASYHVIAALVVPSALNRALAEDLHDRFPQVDTAIYSTAHSLRVPACVKIKPAGVIDDRRFTPLSATGPLADHIGEYLASPQEDSRGQPLPHYQGMYDLPPQIAPGPAQRAVDDCRVKLGPDDQIPPVVLEEICRRFDAPAREFQISKFTRADLSMGFRITPTGGAREKRCPLCADYAHTTDSWFAVPRAAGWYINCFRFRADQGGDGFTVPYSGPNSAPVKQTFARKLQIATAASMSEPLPPTAPLDEYIRFDLRPGLNFVCASLGAGKTQQLGDILAREPNPYQIALMISFRRTFSANMAERLKFESYMDIDSRKLALGDHPRLIVQVDSIQRIAFEGASCIDLLILDEVESILDQLYSVSMRERDQAMLFAILLRRSRTILAMDGALSPRTQEMLQRITCFPGPPQEIEFTRRAHSADRLQVDAFSNNRPENDYYLMNALIQQVEREGPVVCACASVELAIWLAEAVWLNLEAEVMLFHGRDLDVLTSEQEHNRRAMYVIKRDELPQINERILERKPRLLIYTTTITAGISIDVPYFHSAFHIYARHILPTEFAQATARVRHLLDHKARLFISSRANANQGIYVEDRTLSAELRRLSIDPLSAPLNYEIIAALAERRNQIQEASWPLLIDILRDAGYSFAAGIWPPISTCVDPCPITPGEVAEYRTSGRRYGLRLPITEEQWARAELIQRDERKGKGDPDMPHSMENAMFAFKLACSMNMTRQEFNDLGPDLRSAAHALRANTQGSLARLREFESFADKRLFLQQLANSNSDEQEISIPPSKTGDLLSRAGKMRKEIIAQQRGVSAMLTSASSTARDAGSGRKVHHHDYAVVAQAICAQLPCSSEGEILATREQLTSAFTASFATGSKLLSRTRLRSIRPAINNKDPYNIKHLISWLSLAGCGIDVERGGHNKDRQYRISPPPPLTPAS